ncbi:MAG: hypothetical protein QXQ39_05165 [Conexivisphaerales archaeon]
MDEEDSSKPEKVVYRHAEVRGTAGVSKLTTRSEFSVRGKRVKRIEYRINCKGRHIVLIILTPSKTTFFKSHGEMAEQ